MLSREVAEDWQIKTIYKVTWGNKDTQFLTADELTLIAEFGLRKAFTIETLTYKDYLDQLDWTK